MCNLHHTQRRIFGVDYNGRNIYLHLYNGGNSIFYFLEHTCSRLEPSYRTNSSCELHDAAAKTSTKSWPKPESKAPAPNVALQLRVTEDGTLRCFVIALTTLVANDRLRLDWRCYANLLEKWDGPHRQECSCSSDTCRNFSIGSRHPDYFWSLERRFSQNVIEKKHQDLSAVACGPSLKRLDQPQDDDTIFRACIVVPGQRAIHPGDFVIIIIPQSGETRPAQVLYIAKMSSQGAYIGYRMCEWAANEDLFEDAEVAHPRAIYLTPEIVDVNFVYQKPWLPVGVISRKDSANDCKVLVAFTILN